MKGGKSLASQNPLGSTRKFHNWGLMQKPRVEHGSCTSGSPCFTFCLQSLWAVGPITIPILKPGNQSPSKEVMLHKDSH